MKKLIAILLSVVLCLSICVGSVISANESEPEYAYYGRILGLGDSWLCGVGDIPNVKVPVKAAETLGWEYGSLGGAAGGWYLDNVLNIINPERTNNVYDEMVDADTIVIHVGTNDFVSTSWYTTSVKNGTKTFKQLYDALETGYMTGINRVISSIKTANPDALIILGNMWCSAVGWADRLAELETEGLTDDEINAIYEDTRNYYRALAQKSVNAKLAAIADSDENVVLFDVDGLMGYGNEKDGTTYVSSNRHPKASGYELMADEVVKLVREYYGEENPTFAHPVTTPSEETTITTVPGESSSNLALGKNTVSYQLEHDKYPSSEAVDGKTAEDNENRWASAFVDNAWWVVDLGDVYDVDTIKIYWEGAFSKEYKIQVATDEAAWADVSSKNLTNNQKDETYWTTIYTGGATNKGLQEIAIAEDNTARYVCFQGVKRETTYGNSFFEFEVYGSKVEQDGETTVPSEPEETTTTTTQKAEESSSATQPSNPTISSSKLFDADIYADTIKTGKGGYGGDIDKYVVSPSYNDSLAIVDSTLSGGSKVLEVKRTSPWDIIGVNYAKSDLASLAQTSIGFKFWAASNTSTGSQTNNLTVGFRFTDADGNHTYASTDGVWGANQLGELSDEGAYYEINWDTTKIDPEASFDYGHNIIGPAGNGNSDTTRVLDKTKLSTLTAISIIFEGGGTVGSTYYVDDLEFIYDTEAPTTKPTEVEGQTTDVISTASGASIRLNDVNGIRFYTQINENALAELVGDKKYEIGTLIGPKDLVGDYLTAEDEVAQNAVKVVYDMSKGLYEEDGFKGVVGSIANIADKNIARDFMARAYVLVDGVYYYSEAQSVRSLAYVANAFVKDTDNFAKLDTDTQALVEAWASKFNG